MKNKIYPSSSLSPSSPSAPLLPSLASSSTASSSALTLLEGEMRGEIGEGVQGSLELDPTSPSAPIAMGPKRSEFGRADTLQFNILTHVTEGHYERAISELKTFGGQDSPYPKFKEKIERYILHGIDLVYAIKSKRSFMNGQSLLTTSKQQELHEKYRQHFEELKMILGKIEKIHRDLKVEDIRSTALVIKATVNGVFMVFVVAFILEIMSGGIQTLGLITNDVIKNWTDHIGQWLGW